jgi:hypothetical protein
MEGEGHQLSPSEKRPLSNIKLGYLYLEVRCLGCDTHQTVALNIVRQPKATPINELERYMPLQGLFLDSWLS